SVQLGVKKAKTVASLSDNETRQLNRHDAEKLRFFDYVIGNRDRHNENLLVYVEHGEYRPVAVDHVLTLPEGPMASDRFRWPTGLTKDQTGALLTETKLYILSIEPRVVAKTLADAGVSRTATTHALRRLARVQGEIHRGDPSILELRPSDI